MSTCSKNDKETTPVADTNKDTNENGSDEPQAKKQRLSNREYKKLKKGQNKVSKNSKSLHFVHH